MLTKWYDHLVDSNLHGGCSLVVKAPGCGPGDRGFKSHHPPHIRVYMSKKIYFLIIPIICLGLSCFGDNENLKSSSDFSNGPDRYFRLFEASDFGNQVFYFEKTLPPYLSYLLINICIKLKF